MAMDSPTGAPPQQRKGAQRRAEILAHAIELFAKHGVDTSLRAIGDAIGVSHAALRYYFPSRDELLVEVYRTHESSRHDDPERGLASAVGLMERSAEKNAAIPGLVELYATMTTDALQPEQHPLTREFIQARFRKVRTDLGDRIRADQAAGAIAPDIDADAAAALVAAASDGLQLQWLLDPESVDIGRSLAILERLLPAAAPSSAP